MRRPLAILLCAGYGTRLAAVAGDRPKALLPVAGRPVIDYLLDQLVALPELREVHLVTNARFAADLAHWAEGAAAATGLAVAVHDDGTRSAEERLGAVGDLAFVLRRLAGGKGEAEGFSGALVAAGDNVLRFPLAPLWRRFVDRGGCHLLALPERDPERLRRTGVLVLDDDDRVRELHEKPPRPPSEWVAPPFYALDAAALAAAEGYLAAGGARDEIGRFVAHLAATRPVWALRTAGERLDIGSPDSWRRADETLRREGVFPSPSPGRGSGRAIEEASDREM